MNNPANSGQVVNSCIGAMTVTNPADRPASINFLSRRASLLPMLLPRHSAFLVARCRAHTRAVSASLKIFRMAEYRPPVYHSPWLMTGLDKTYCAEIIVRVYEHDTSVIYVSIVVSSYRLHWRDIRESKYFYFYRAIHDPPCNLYIRVT